MTLFADAGSTCSAASDGPLQVTAREWVLKLASKEMSQSDFEALKAWRSASPAHEHAFAEARRSWRNLRPLKSSFVHHEHARRFAALPLWRCWRLVPAGALAATILAVLAFMDPVTRLRADRVTARGEIQEITLPDGSRAMLNTHSALGIDFVANERKITLLQGEAWFQVRHDSSRPFIVHARNGQVRALGTAFGVRADEDDLVTVVVTEGTVSVFANGRSPQRATVNEQVVYGPTQPVGSAAPVDAPASLSWRDRRVVIVNRTLDDAVAELRRYHPGVVVVLGSAADLRVTGVFDIDAIDEGLQGIAAARNLRVIRLTPLLTILR